MAVLNLDDNGSSPCSLSNTEEKLLLTKQGAEAQIRRNNVASRAEGSPGFFLLVSSEKGTHLYVTPRSHFYIYYIVSRYKALKEAFPMG